MTTPYVYLAGVGLLLLFITWGTRPAPLRVWIFFVTAGSVALTDLFLAGILNYYEYTPGLLPGRLDTYLGELLAECLFVPSVYTALTVVPPRWRLLANVLTVVPFVALEWFLIRLGVYQHHGWSHMATALLFAAYGTIVAQAVRSFERNGYGQINRGVFVAFSLYYLLALWGMMVTGVLRLASIRLGTAPHREMDELYTNFILVAPPFLLLGWAGIWQRAFRRPLQALLVGVFFAIWFSVLSVLDIRQDFGFWNPLLDGLSIGAAMFGVARLDGWLEKRVS